MNFEDQLFYLSNLFFDTSWNSNFNEFQGIHLKDPLMLYNDQERYLYPITPFLGCTIMDTRYIYDMILNTNKADYENLGN